MNLIYIMMIGESLLESISKYGCRIVVVGAMLVLNGMAVTAEEVPRPEPSWTIGSGQFSCSSGAFHVEFATSTPTWYEEGIGLPSNYHDVQVVCDAKRQRALVAEFSGNGSTVSFFGGDCRRSWMHYYPGLEMNQFALIMDDGHAMAAMTAPNFESFELARYPGDMILWDMTGREVFRVAADAWGQIGPDQLQMHYSRYGEMHLPYGRFFFFDIESGDTHMFTWPENLAGGEIAISPGGKLVIRATSGYQKPDGSWISAAAVEHLPVPEMSWVIDHSKRVYVTVDSYQFHAK